MSQRPHSPDPPAPAKPAGGSGTQSGQGVVDRIHALAESIRRQMGMRRQNRARAEQGRPSAKS
ncbi:hypothetical protein [Teichococcus vastitatis]|jgi:hypothetical protein|uniref:Uncharacterized protein n=1 Tax=Teichococcus vastitatis TaxID=2307076 RepID=A0ABS9W373_9PROT|nr:hypothetical protein [Pseudoroseomonas vastitatis]MCI0753723.1 hypothetical protein [Pseudoroseomonas vastitatis]